MTVILAKILLSLYVVQWYHDRMIWIFDMSDKPDCPAVFLHGLNLGILALAAHCIWQVL